MVSEMTKSLYCNERGGGKTHESKNHQIIICLESSLLYESCRESCHHGDKRHTHQNEKTQTIMQCIILGQVYTVRRLTKDGDNIGIERHEIAPQRAVRVNQRATRTATS